ncbi:MAG: biotin-dependent carboxyltransferase family protein [Bacteroidota bacterium]
MPQVKFKILQPGQMSTLQDGGRIGYRSFGIPKSGFMDDISARQANWLVSNQIDHTLIEMIQVGGTIEFLTNARIALTGADMEATLDGDSVDLNKSILTKTGQILKLGKAKVGMIGYLAVGGQWQVPEVLGSSSTYARAGLGGLVGLPLKREDIITVEDDSDPRDRSLPEHEIRNNISGRKIRVLSGPESDDRSLSWLIGTSHRVSNQWDRMGIRLTSERKSTEGGSILTSPVSIGTIQLPADGNPIIIMADGQTTGGYKRIATIIKADLPYLAQQPPFVELRFKSVSHEEALHIANWVSQ